MIYLKLLANSEKRRVTLFTTVIRQWKMTTFPTFKTEGRGGTYFSANIVLGQGDQNRIEVWDGDQLIQTVYLNGYRTFSRTDTTIVLVPRGGGVPTRIPLTNVGEV